MKDKKVLALAAIVCVTALEVVNMLTIKSDGYLFSLAVAAIAGLGGFIVGGKK